MQLDTCSASFLSRWVCQAHAKKGMKCLHGAVLPTTFWPGHESSEACVLMQAQVCSGFCLCKTWELTRSCRRIRREGRNSHGLHGSSLLQSSQAGGLGHPLSSFGSSCQWETGAWFRHELPTFSCAHPLFSLCLLRPLLLQHPFRGVFSCAGTQDRGRFPARALARHSESVCLSTWAPAARWRT